MAKIKISADTVLAILKGIMEDEDINVKITDPTAPKEWQGKTVQEVLNVEYYTFKHRPMDTEQLVADLIKQGKDADALLALTRAFCILSLKSTERVFSKENDIATVSASLEYWIQTDKVKVLEDMLEDIIIESTGIRIPVKVGNEERQVLIAIGKLTISDLQETTEFGEMSVCDLDIDLIFYPNATTMADYKVEFLIGEDWVQVPGSSVSIALSMNQKAIPTAKNKANVGQLNLSKVTSFVLTFDGWKNKFIDKLVKFSLSTEEEQDNNEAFYLKLTRNEIEYTFTCVVKDHIVKVQEDTGNETHSLTLTIRGKNSGTT